jgi:hypothetical protein
MTEWLELNESSIVEAFKKDLSSFKFLSTSDHAGILQHLDVLASTQKKRHEKRESAAWLWKVFLRESLAHVTPNLRGYPELCKYFDRFVGYENMLIALDKSYRDHVIHTLWVMLLGFHLRKKLSVLNNLQFTTIGDVGFEAGQEKKLFEDTQGQLRGWEEPLWCLASLTHDLGYPIEKSRQANAIIGDMIGSFGFLARKDLEYDFTIVHQPAVDHLLNAIACKIVFTPNGFRLCFVPGQRLDFAKSFERLDHGIMSAFLILTYLDFICDVWGIMDVEGAWNTNKEVGAGLAFVSELLKSVAAHTNRYSYTGDVRDLDSLLFLCDELEEFSRYRVVLDEWTNVKCRTAVRCDPAGLGLRFVFEDVNLGDMPDFFKKKARKARNRFEPRLGTMQEISVESEDVRPADHLKLKYSKTPSGEKVEEAPSGKVHSDVLAYLGE